ncbi:MAG: SPOR domain-containing protein [Bacteroidetes bacterium]|nr:SPOR domain-containing protein [Bacteroidota bacterium]
MEQHISELLYDHDCVIVPSFGGFLASYNPANIHPSRHVFSPPSKKIAFNVFLKQNDGLLANHISRITEISYADALSRVEQHVHEWQKELAAGKKLIIDRIGTFTLDAEKNLRFDPEKDINYLRDAFGLSPVQFLPVKREGMQQKVEKQVKELMTSRPSLKQEKQALKISKKTKQRILSTLIISSTLLWFSFNLYIITPHRFDLGSLNPFSAGSSTESVRKESMPVPGNVITASPSRVETVYVAKPVAINPGIAEPGKPEEINPVQKTTPTVASPEGNYYVIAGAFQYLENAESMVKSLQTEGFTESKILDPSDHLKKVCFKGFASRLEAVQESDRLKALGKSSWIFKW